MSKPFNFDLNLKSTSQNRIGNKKFEKGSVKSHISNHCIDSGVSLELEVRVSAEFGVCVGLGERLFERVLDFSEFSV